MKHHKFELQYINLLSILKRYIEDEWCNSQDDGDGRWNVSPQDEGEAIGRAYKRALLAYDEAQACFMLAQSRHKELLIQAVNEALR